MKTAGRYILLRLLPFFCLPLAAQQADRTPSSKTKVYLEHADMQLFDKKVLILRRRMPAMIDWIFKMINGMVGGILEGDEISSYLPLLGSLFIFILCANLLSVIPGLTSPTADVNTTFALALVVFFAVHFYGIRRKGLWVYLKTFANPPLLFPLELLSHFSRTLALTLRRLSDGSCGDRKAVFRGAPARNFFSSSSGRS